MKPHLGHWDNIHSVNPNKSIVFINPGNRLITTYKVAHMSSLNSMFPSSRKTRSIEKKEKEKKNLLTWFW